MKKYFIILVVLLATSLFISKNALHYSPIFINILNDILALPLILLLLDIAMQLIYGYKYKMNLGLVLLTFVTISILFELLFPIISNKAISDPMDIVWYFAGSLIYLTVNFKNINKTFWKTNPL